MTALKIVQEICRVLGLDVPSTLTNASDTGAQRVLGVLNRAVAAAQKAYNWQELQKQIIFKADVLSDAYNPATGGLKLRTLAPDFGQAVTPQLYEMNALHGVYYLSPDDFTRLTVEGIGSVDKYFSVMGGELLFLPKLSENSWSCLMRYGSKYAVTDASGTGKAGFDQDDDESPLDSELLVLGGVYKFKQEMGYDYADAQEDYEQCLQALAQRNGYAPVLRGTRTDAPRVRLNIPDTGAGWEL